MTKLISAAIICFLWSSFTYGQLINNHSIEGANRPNRPPSFWYPCSPESTPDTQPLAYGVQLAAADGRTYLSLVTRKLGIEPYEVKEDVETRLNLPLISGFPYLLTINLAWSPQMSYEENGGLQEVNNPVRLRIYGGLESCDRAELLWQSPVCDSPEWVQLEVNIKPETDNLRYLILEAYPANGEFQDGNILIDNIRLQEEPVRIPTTFTPNGDGINDLFVVKGLRPQSKLEIMSRDGRRVFASEDYQNDWDGGDWPAGVYFYTLTTTIKPQRWKGELSIMK